MNCIYVCVSVSKSMREIRNKRDWKGHFVYVLLTLLSLECSRMWQGRTMTVIVELLSFRSAFFFFFSLVILTLDFVHSTGAESI